MRGFYSILPTLSPDFSGVCSTLFELGGILAIHDAGGCTGTYTGYDEPRWFDQRSRVFTSNLDDAEAVFGDDSIFLNKLLSADEWLDSKKVCEVLSISSRSLQHLRNNGTLSFTRIDKKIFYRKQDVMSLLTTIQKKK